MHFEKLFNTSRFILNSNKTVRTYCNNKHKQQQNAMICIDSYFFSSARFRDSERNASECILLVLQRRRVHFFRFLHFPRMFQINLTLISWFFEFLVVLHTVLEHADKKKLCHTVHWTLFGIVYQLHWFIITFKFQKSIPNSGIQLNTCIFGCFFVFKFNFE